MVSTINRPSSTYAIPPATFHTHVTQFGFNSTALPLLLLLFEELWDLVVDTMRKSLNECYIHSIPFLAFNKKVLNLIILCQLTS